jgi:dihydropyrimidine dehydrogenase (NAD+) subunit PreT
MSEHEGMRMPQAGDRSNSEELARRFAEVPPLKPDEALIEASRCLYCFDAPCTRACPTGIDVSRFIRQILHRDEIGAARTILEANVFGGSCARACPTEVLCEGACVDRVLSGHPIPIGRLQRHACDTAVERDVRFFEPGPPTGLRVGVVGAGPAGLSCAHELRRLGHEVIVFEAHSIPGGLDTQGVAAYKVSTEFVLAEIERICSIGIDLRLNHPVDPDDLPDLIAEHKLAAFFIGIGLGRTKPLLVEGEGLGGVWESLDFIAQTRLRPFEDCEVGRQVVVIGAGNTAIDAATAARRLGADRVTIAYRKDEASMPAFAFEYELAKHDGVGFEWFARPLRILGEDGLVRGVEFVRTRFDESGELRSVPNSNFVLPADMVVKALGQGTLNGWDWIDEFAEHVDEHGRIDGAFLSKSAQPNFGFFVGGDCLNKGGEVVDAVQDGKRAAWGIDAYIRQT